MSQNLAFTLPAAALALILAVAIGLAAASVLVLVNVIDVPHWAAISSLCGAVGFVFLLRNSVRHRGS
jgi:hypothetical protein